MTVTVSLLAAMADLDEVDYSSDRLESSDIWDVPSGGLEALGVEIPRLGLENHVSANLGSSRLEVVTSPSDFLILSPVEQVPVETQADTLSYLPAVLLDSLRWQEVGVYFSSPKFQGGFEPVKGFE